MVERATVRWAAPRESAACHRLLEGRASGGRQVDSAGAGLNGLSGGDFSRVPHLLSEVGFAGATSWVYPAMCGVYSHSSALASSSSVAWRARGPAPGRRAASVRSCTSLAAIDCLVRDRSPATPV